MMSILLKQESCFSKARCQSKMTPMYAVANALNSSHSNLCFLSNAAMMSNTQPMSATGTTAAAQAIAQAAHKMAEMLCTLPSNFSRYDGAVATKTSDAHAMKARNCQLYGVQSSIGGNIINAARASRA